MKILYLDCGMGAAGDMLTAAMLELLPEPEQEAFLAEMNALALPGVTVEREKSVKCGITGTRMVVKTHGEEEGEFPHGHHHHDEEEDPVHEPHDEHEDQHAHDHRHSGMKEIAHILSHLPVSPKVRGDVLAIYGRIAEAESHVHGVPVTEIHFHEVGTMDAVTDVTAVSLLMERLAPDEVVVSPVHVGCGEVRCAHGILPVPAPAAAYLLRGVPIYGGSVRGELCTPTGAALLRHFATRFGDMPIMRVTGIGYGMGKKEFPRANCVRAMLGEREEGGTDEMVELSCNVDDMTAEEIGFAMDRLFEGGAREVYTVPIGMKKCRPGTLLRVIVDAANRDEAVRLLFRHTTTLGVREVLTKRYILDRRVERMETSFGPVRRKVSLGYGVTREKLEYDDLAALAEKNGWTLAEARKKIENL